MKTWGLFSQTQWQLENARRALRYMRASGTTGTFRFMFDGFVQHARNITWALQKEGSPVHGFRSWYEGCQESLKNDGLAQWFNEARAKIVHEGVDILAYNIQFTYPALPLGDAPNGHAGCIVEPDNSYWIIWRETESERLEPMNVYPDVPWGSAPQGAMRAIFSYDGAYWEVRHPDGDIQLVEMLEARYKSTVQIAYPPTYHQGRTIAENRNPVKISELHLSQLEQIVAAARKRFDTRS